MVGGIRCFFSSFLNNTLFCVLEMWGSKEFHDISTPPYNIFILAKRPFPAVLPRLGRTQRDTAGVVFPLHLNATSMWAEKLKSPSLRCGTIFVFHCDFLVLSNSQRTSWMSAGIWPSAQRASDRRLTVSHFPSIKMKTHGDLSGLHSSDGKPALAE